MPFTAAVAFILKGWPWSMVLFMAHAVGGNSGGLAVIVTRFDVADNGGWALSVTLTYRLCVPDSAVYV